MRSYLDKRCRPHLKPTNDSWRVDETYIKVKGEDKYLYPAVDSKGNTLNSKLLAPVMHGFPPGNIVIVGKVF